MNERRVRGKDGERSATSATSANNPFAKFESLPEERREAIVNAAVETFGRNDYKSASTEAIARRAGISKGLLFFYFKNKKELYLYLMEHLMSKIEALVVDEEFYQIDDFFELFLYAAERKRDVLERFPFLMEFSIRAFYPDHKDIKDTMDNWNWSKIDLMFNTYFKNVRFDRFRDDVDPRYVVDLMIWLADGYMHQQRALRRPISIDGMMDEMRRWCEMLRAYAYKEEYR
ncbi:MULTISPECIES: TetR/AcrR family transcriptional regulator [Gordonibacter]|uniref:TetR/AcrR family transcriptional regulator n=1 Tax=Gordonibacter faecis TaxID=3047475 RepID=A0ABT7DKD9_9ACTN|nr:MULTISPECIES: TetR/AcrR family transcriptional regulator [unclassified Gordonibacter]MDJ1649995.1 TetR/AcrR family transcriptional regulator [Gordonibacter sp. KGMB12511]HIW76685.1 TetR/AcrR family transcriptional regulator [Candidatus Gordonibacter avicola]